MNPFQSQFEASLKSESKRHRLGIIFFSVAILGAIAVYLWRCQFGVDLTDEAFYLTPAWKFFELGDLPFRDEIFNGLRHSDLLNYLLVKPLLPYDVLTLRWGAVIFYSLSLLSLTLVCFRGHIGIVSTLAFLSCLLFDYFLMPTWSYNWWCRNALLIHHAALFLAATVYKDLYRKWLIPIAGSAIAILSIAYNPLVLVFAVGGIYCWFNLRRWFKWYLYPALTLLGLDALFCLHPAIRNDWWISVKSLSTMGEYSVEAAIHKAWGTLCFVLLHPEFYLVLLGAIVLWDEPVWNEKFPRLSRLLSRIRWVGFVLIPILALRFSAQLTPERTVQDFAAVSMAGAIILLLTAWVKKDKILALCTVQSIAVAWGMALSSTNQHLALYWALPTLLIPFAALATQETTSRMKGKSGWQRFESLGGLVVVCLVILKVGYGAFQHQRLHNYYDVPPGNCSAEVNVAPLKGLKTSPRRAELVKKLASLVEKETFALVYADLPGAYWFGNVRSAADTSIVETEAPLTTNLRSIERIYSRSRVPTVIIQANNHPWYWGIHHPFADLKLVYPENDPYLKLGNCVRGDAIHESKEFSAFQVDLRKWEECRPKLEPARLVFRP